MFRPIFDMKPSLYRQAVHLSRSRNFFTALCTTTVYIHCIYFQYSSYNFLIQNCLKLVKVKVKDISFILLSSTPKKDLPYSDRSPLKSTPIP